MLYKIKHFLNSPITPQNHSYGYNVHIEQYRGICALLVLINHIFTHPDWLLDNFKWPIFTEYLGSGYFSVLIFFCISGYAIGMSNTLKNFNVLLYLKKRFVRLYPPYIFAFILCLLIGGIRIGWWVIISNFFFLQNPAPYFHLNIPIFINSPTWSLNFEVIYYLLFITLFLSRPKIWHLFIIMIPLALLLRNSSSNIAFFTSYLYGYFFWLLGLFFSWGIIGGNSIKESTIPFLSLLFLHLCEQQLIPSSIILHFLHISYNTSFFSLLEIPFCIFIIGSLLFKGNLLIKLSKYYCYSLPGVIFIYLLVGHRLFIELRWIMSIIFWILSLAFLYEKKISAFLLNKLTVVGKISYAIYIFHTPIALLIKKTIIIQNKPLEILAKYFLWIGLTFTLAILFEIYLQPAIKKYFVSK